MASALAELMTDSSHLVVTHPHQYAALEALLKPLRLLLSGDITELVINEPNVVWTEGRDGWKKHDLPGFGYEQMIALAKTIANASQQKIDAVNPVLSAPLPTGERVQIVIPPAITNGHISFTIRKPSKLSKTLDGYVAEGYFSRCRVPKNITPQLLNDTRLFENERILIDALLKRDFNTFFTQAILTNQNLVTSGATGSGKTTFMKTLANLIPLDERIITIEDVHELFLPNHKNKVHLFYSKGGQGVAKVSPKELLEACLRMYPNRILLAELRGEETFYYLRNVNSGHPGSLTSIHAADEYAVFDQMALLIKESEAGRGIPIPDIKLLLSGLVDITVQCDKHHGERYCAGIYYDPLKRRSEGV
jgi:type IV secretion system protein VirB11